MFGGLQVTGGCGCLQRFGEWIFGVDDHGPGEHRGQLTPALQLAFQLDDR